MAQPQIIKCDAWETEFGTIPAEPCVASSPGASLGGERGGGARGGVRLGFLADHHLDGPGMDGSLGGQSSGTQRGAWVAACDSA